MSWPNVTFEVVGSGMLARAFIAANSIGPQAIICAAGVADSRCVDPSAFRRERDLLLALTRRARASGSVLVYFSGAPVYGSAEGIRTETDQVAPETPYGRHKLECEQLVAGGGAPYLVLRLPNVVGPEGNPSQTSASRDLLDVDDLVAIVAALLRRGAVDSVLNVASGISIPVERMAEIVAAVLGVSPSIAAVGGGDRQEFSIAVVRDVLPTYPRFDSDYPTGVLMRRVPSIERALRERAVV